MAFSGKTLDTTEQPVRRKEARIPTVIVLLENI
jgi:hypothetical protein